MTPVKWNVWMVRCLLCACLCSGLWVPAQARQATQTDPTNAAFGALLAMPAAAPTNGIWEHFTVEKPADFDAEAASQEDLISYLDEQRKRGARFDSYQLQGTLFHHAVRARLLNVALWLLRHGVNPRLKLENVELDGMGITIKMGTWRVFDALRKHPAYANLSKEGLSVQYGQLVRESPEAMRVLLDKKLWVIGTPQVQSDLTVQSSVFLTDGKPGDALALLNLNPTFAPASASCSSSVSYKPNPFPTLHVTPAQWRAVIERLPVKLQGEGWLCAFRYASSKNEAQAMLAASAVDLWRDPLLTAQTARLSLANSAWAGQLRTMPQAGLVAALAKSDFQAAWLKGIVSLPLADLAWALNLVQPVMTSGTTATAIGHWTALLGKPGTAQTPDSVERWRLLAQTSPPGGGQGVVGLVFVKPVTIWAAWLDKGYVFTSGELNYWLRDAKTEELKLVLPILQKNVPAFVQQALTHLVEPLYSGDGYWGADQLAKAELLATAGAQVQKPYPLAAAFRAINTQAKNAGDIALGAAVAKAIERRWVIEVPSSERPVVEVVKELGCKPVVSAAMRLSVAAWDRYKAPAANPYEVDAALSSVEALKSVNQETCAWLATGGEPPGRKFIYDIDFFDGVNRLTPCADGNTVNGVWNEPQGNWSSLKDAQMFGSMYRLRLKDSKNEALLEWRDGGGGCGRNHGVIYSAHDKNKPVEFVVAGRGHPVYDALVQQCDLSQLDECLKLSEPQIATPSPSPPLPLPLSWSAKYLPNERQAFLAAVERFDTTALNQAKAAGLFADWVQSGLRQVGESRLSLEDKRKRAAWLLAHRPLLANALHSETIASLLSWLPVQDWQPVVYAMRCEQRTDWNSFTQVASAAKREDVLERAQTTCPAGTKK